VFSAFGDVIRVCAGLHSVATFRAPSPTSVRRAGWHFVALVGTLSPGCYPRSPDSAMSEWHTPERVGRIRPRVVPAMATKPLAGDDLSRPIGFLTRRRSMAPGPAGRDCARSPTYRMPRLSKFINAPIENPAVLLRNSRPRKEKKNLGKINFWHRPRPSGFGAGVG
jgi:hypothetical protein